MINWFRNLKIAHKLVATAVVLLVGFLALGAVYVVEVQVTNTLAKEAAEVEQLVTDMSELRSTVAAARRAADQFFSKSGALENLEAFKQAMDKAVGALNELNQRFEKAEYQEAASQLDSALTAFAQIFDNTTEAKIQLGLDQNSGLRGQVNETIAQLANTLEGATANQTPLVQGLSRELQTRFEIEQLRSSMLTMRQHEKNYIEREDDSFITRIADERSTYETLLKGSTLAAKQKTQFSGLLDAYFASMLGLVEATKRFNALRTQFNEQEQSIARAASELEQHGLASEKQLREDVAAQQTIISATFGAVLLGVAAVTFAAILLMAQGMIRPLRRLSRVVQEIAQGNLEARAQMRGGDELARFGNAFDQMLDERVSDLARQAEENGQLNESVITLMEAAERLSQRDLTVIVPVGEDITGNVSDALNLMTREIADVMGNINGVAVQLEQVANAVHQQGDKVADVAANERQVVTEALVSLEQSASTMAEIAQISGNTNELASNASDSTKKALGVVRTTVRSMGEIRNSVSEAEKSIKRLGERSQEISAIVEIIKDIAERTHTLALNAGMQAVAAGEAGRGFSMVADEVQRLAETARESTNQISTLVQNIQAESSESMVTMNKTITQVVHGSQLAERAGKRMRLTQRATENLVSSVAEIAVRSKFLESTNEELRERAAALQQSTEATEQELRTQAEQTNTMFVFLQNLVQSVRVFKLPDAA